VGAHVGAQIVEQGLPAAQHRLVLHLRFEQPKRRRLGDLDRRRRTLADLADADDRLGIGGEQTGEAAEIVDQFPGERLGVPARQRESKQIFN
jgi:hypothetical protein